MASSCMSVFLPKPYPMWVAPMTFVRGLQRFEPHEELLQKSSLEEHITHSTMPVLFVTHTWLSANHPDPDGRKLELLKRFVARGVAGRLSVGPHWAASVGFGLRAGDIGAREIQSKLQHVAIWIDYSCIPQKDPNLRQKAFESIPAYLAACSLFVCIVPPLRHSHGTPRDLRAWRARGWCRFEFICNVLSFEPKKMILVQSMSSIEYLNTSDWLARSVGTGRFSIKNDKALLGPVLARMLERRQFMAGQQKDWDGKRLILSTAAVVLRGLAQAKEVADSDDSKSFSDWMKELHFSGLNDYSAMGLTPLRMAVHYGRLDIINDLLQAGVDVHAPLKYNSSWLGALNAGAHILHSACYIRDQPKVVFCLVWSHADVAAVGDCGYTAMHMAAFSGHIGNMEAITSADDEARRAPGYLGENPVQALLIRGFKDQFIKFIKRHPDRGGGRRLSSGATLYHAAIMHEAPLDVFDVLWDRSDIDAQIEQVSMKWLGIYAYCNALCLLGKPSMFTELGANAVGITPLGCAAIYGDVLLVQALLEHRADVQKGNAVGRPPLTLTAMRGHLEVLELLLEARAATERRDAWGRTALSWAERQGHKEVKRLLSDCEQPAEGPCTFASRACPTATAEEELDSDWESLMISM